PKAAYNAGGMKKMMILSAALLVCSGLLQSQTAAPNQESSHAAAPDSPQCQAAALGKQGRKLQNDGKLDQAIIEEKKALALSPDFYDAESAIGAALDLIMR